MQLKGIPWGSAPIRVSRRLWQFCTIAAFVVLGSWRCIETKGPMSSLFDGMLETFHDIGMEMHEGPGGVLAGTGVMLVWCAGYAAVSAAIGWLVAAVASAIVQTASWRKSQRRE